MSQISDVKVAKRYAGALFGAANQLGKIDAVQRDLDTLMNLWHSTPALPQAMESPEVPAEKKNALIDEIFGRDLDPMTVSFLHLLVDKRRENILDAVQTEYRERVDRAQGLIRATAFVSAPLEDGQRARLVQGLSQRTGKRIELDVAIDPALLGGVVVRMNDTVIDGSVRGALERLRERMLQER